MDRLRRLIAALWFGSAVFLMLSASAAFRAAGTPAIAADVVGAMLTRWHYIALAAPLLLLVLELKRARPVLLLILFTGVILAASQSFIDLRIRAIRTAVPAGVSNLDPEHPTRKRFGALHGVSMALQLAQAIAAALVVMSRDRSAGARPADSAPAAPPAPVEMPAPPRVEEDETSGGGP